MVEDYHGVFDAEDGSHREASCLIGGKFPMIWMDLMNTWWLQTWGLLVSGTSGGVGGTTIFVDRTFCSVCLRCPFVVARDLGYRTARRSEERRAVR